MNKVKGVCPYCKQRTSFFSTPEEFGFDDNPDLDSDVLDFKKFMMEQMLKDQIGYTDFNPNLHPEEQMQNIVEYWKPITFTFKKHHFDDENMYREVGTNYRLPFDSVYVDFDEFIKLNVSGDNFIVFKNFALSEDDGGKLVWIYFLFSLLEDQYTMKGLPLNKLLAIEKEEDEEDNTLAKSTVWYGDGTNEFDITDGKFKFDKRSVKKIKCFCENMIRFLNDNKKEIVYVDRYPRRLRNIFIDKKLKNKCGYIPIKDKIEIKPFLKRIKKDSLTFSRIIKQRKGHFVTYRSDRYVNVKGRTVWRKGFVKNPDDVKEYRQS